MKFEKMAQYELENELNRAIAIYEDSLIDQENMPKNTAIGRMVMDYIVEKRRQKVEKLKKELEKRAENK